MSKIRRVDYSPDEFLSGTSDLDVAEKGAYWVVCSLIYSRGGPVPDDAKWIATVAGCSVRMWTKLRDRLVTLGKLQIEAGFISNRRAAAELFKAENRVAAAREAAEESARVRRERLEKERLLRENKELAQADASPNAQANHQPPTTKEREDSHSQAGRASPLPAGWQPSEALLERARKCRPDIVPARLKLETQAFTSRKRSDNAHSHNWDEAFINWILKTKIGGQENGSQRTSQPQRRGGTSTRATWLAGFGGLGAQRPDGPPDGETEPELVGSASLADPE